MSHVPAPDRSTDARSPTRLKLPPPQAEHTRWSPGLIGFYLSCAGVALGATFGASGYFFFGSEVWPWIGGAMSVVCAVTCFTSLHHARRGPGSSAQ